MKARPIAPVKRVAVTREEAAAALGVSLSHFERHVQPQLRIIYSGSARLVLVSELEAWAERASTLAGHTHQQQRPPRRANARGPDPKEMRSGAARTRSGDRYKPSAIRDYERGFRLRLVPAIGGSRLEGS